MAKIFLSHAGFHSLPPEIDERFFRRMKPKPAGNLCGFRGFEA